MRTSSFGGWKVTGLCHAKGREYVFLNVDVLGLAGELLDQRAEQNEVDIGVAESLTWTRLQRRGERTTNAFGFMGSVESPRIFEFDVSRFA